MAIPIYWFTMAPMSCHCFGDAYNRTILYLGLNLKYHETNATFQPALDGSNHMWLVCGALGSRHESYGVVVVSRGTVCTN